MKKIFCIIISILLLTVSLTSCTNLQAEETTAGEKEDIFSEEEDDEKARQEASILEFAKQFLGGTGYIKESSESAHFEYDGGEISFDYAIHNMAAGFECGLFVILNGVFQKFTFKSADGEETDEDYMHKTYIPEKDSATFTLTFTPNTGKQGDLLNLAVGTLTVPSHTAVYDGWGRYGKYSEHTYSGLSGMTVLMNCDSIDTVQPSEKPEISQTQITDEYFNYVTDDDESEENEDKNEKWKNTYLFALYYDEYNFEKDLIVVPETDTVKLKLDMMGMEREYRVSVFINNEIVEFEDGSTYFEVQNTAEAVTHIEFPVDISDIPNNSHIYAIIAEKVVDENDTIYGTFTALYKTRTCYFIKGEVPEITTASETDVTA